MWPVVLVTMPATTRDADIDFLRDSYVPVHAASIRHILIVDTYIATIVTIPNARLRRRLKDFEATRRSIIQRTNIGSAIVISKAVVRGAYTALRWISPPTTPSRAFPKLSEAARWCIEGLKAEGQEAPEGAYVMAGMRKAI